MKQQLQDSKATSLPQLQQVIKELWTLQMDNIQYLKNLAESMHAEEAGGSYPEQGKLHQVLASMFIT